MWPFTPRYLKHARLLHKGVIRFINYKRDLLSAEKLQEIEGLRTQLVQAIKLRNKEQIESLQTQLNETCERALPEHATNTISENIEVFFVAITIALGIRSYIAQPFQIPTGSMQPTLNGYIGEYVPEAPFPGMFQRLVDRLKGIKYVETVSDHTGRLRTREPITEHNRLIYTYSTLHFEDGHTIDIPVPKSMLESRTGKDPLGYRELTKSTQKMILSPEGKPIIDPEGQAKYAAVGGTLLTKGQLIARGKLTSGDHVLVNKFSYHFRKPTRGEVFVFTTKNIDLIDVPSEQGSQHYIKRIAGLPGDTISFAETGHLSDVQGFKMSVGKLIINGKPAEEPSIQRVQTEQNGYRGYGIFNNAPDYCKVIDRKLGVKEYAAFGDNSMESSDSRYWGSVPQQNLVGVGLFCYFPFGSHWGRID
jgi:signal peptidase I